MDPAIQCLLVIKDSSGEVFSLSHVKACNWSLCTAALFCEEGPVSKLLPCDMEKLYKTIGESRNIPRAAAYEYCPRAPRVSVATRKAPATSAIIDSRIALSDIVQVEVDCQATYARKIEIKVVRRYKDRLASVPI